MADETTHRAEAERLLTAAGRDASDWKLAKALVHAVLALTDALEPYPLQRWITGTPDVDEDGLPINTNVEP